MTKEEILERIAAIGREISLLFGELSAELSETDSRAWLRFVKNDTRGNSEVKKMSVKYLTFQFWRCREKISKNKQTGTAARNYPRRRPKKRTKQAIF